MDLTERDQKIAYMVSNGKTNKQIASALGLTKKSVDNIMTGIYRRLGITSGAKRVKFIMMIINGR